MEGKLDTHIRVSKLTKQRIKAMAKGSSYEENIVAFLDYFERTGINPKSLKEHPIDVTIKGFDRMIAILKSIEKTKLDTSMKKLINIENLLSPLADWVQNGMAGTNNKNPDTGSVIGEGKNQVSEEELTAIVEMNQNLNNKIDELEEEIKKKNSEIFELSNSGGSTDSEEMKAIIKRISDITKRLEDGARKASFGNDYTLKSADYTYILQSLKNVTR